MSTNTTTPATTADVAPAYKSEELIVGLSELGFIKQRFSELGIFHRAENVDRTLGLARLVLTDVDQAAAAVMRVVGEAELVADGEAPTDPLDQVLWGLRRLFAKECGGWMPTLGKNRLMGRVHGVWGHVIHGGDGDPEMIQGWTPPTSRGTGPGRGVRIGVLDTGFYPHPWLEGAWSARYSDRIGPVAAEYADGHATFVAGLILSQAPGATIEVRGALRQPDGSADAWTVATEAVQFARSGLDVLNLSMACYTEDGEPPLLISRAVERLGADLAIVVAAGNGLWDDKQAKNVPSDRPAYPAALDGVIAVGACDESNQPADFSPRQPWVDVQARGVRVRSTYLNSVTPKNSQEQTFNGWASWSGTSFAAALVSGAIAAGIEPGRISGPQSAADLLAAVGLTRQGDTPPTVELSVPVWATSGDGK